MDDSKRVYIMQYEGLFKIGISGNPSRRLLDLEKELEIEGMVLLSTFKFKRARRMELNWHKRFRSKNIHGEWFFFCQKDLDWIYTKFGTYIDEVFCDPDFSYMSSELEELHKEYNIVSKKLFSRYTKIRDRIFKKKKPTRKYYYGSKVFKP